MYKLILLLTITSSYLSFAQNRDLNDLVSQKERPTVEQVISYLDLIEMNINIQDAKNGGAYTNGGRLEKMFWRMMEDAPRFIAHMERSFPGATFAFIGRDAFALADMVDAFYLSIGQKGRVVRIGVSKGSFDNTYPVDDYKIYMEFLESNGFSWKNVKNGKPFVFVDTISSGGGRQGRSLLDVIYRDWVAKGNKAHEILNKVNMIGLIVSTYPNGNPVYPIEDFEKHLEKEKKRYKNEKIESNFFEEHRMPMFKDSGRLFGESGYDHFVRSWHDSYGNLYRRNGQVLSKRGSQYNVQNKMTVLNYLKAIIQKVSAPTFHKRVAFWANNLGYSFPTGVNGSYVLKNAAKPDSSVKSILKKMDKMSADLYILPTQYVDNVDQWYNELKDREGKDRETSSSSKLIKIIQVAYNWTPSVNFTYILNKVDLALSEDKITQKDFIKIYEYFLSLQDPSRGFFDAIFDGSKMQELLLDKNFVKSLSDDNAKERHKNMIKLYKSLSSSGQVFCSLVFRNMKI